MIIAREAQALAGPARERVPWRDYKPLGVPEGGHDALADDLAGYLLFHKRPHFVWRNVTFGLGMCIDAGLMGRWLKECREEGGGHKWCDRKTRMETRDCRPDVLALRAQVPPPCGAPAIYEIKVSRADFWADVRAGKWRQYLRIAPVVYFAAPNGLIEPAEVPEGAGLIVRMNDHWRRRKAATPATWAPTDRFWMTLLYRGRDPMPWEGGR